MKLGTIAIVAGLTMIMVSIAWAEVPNMINNQGRLTTPAGVPLFNDPTNAADGQIDLVFSIYDAPTNGAALWGQTNANVAVHNGLFSVLLGNFGTNVFPATGQVARWLELTVVTNGIASTLSPRKEIVSVAYALRAGDAATWGGLPAAELISLQTNVAGIQTNLGNIWSNVVYIQGSVAGIETNVAGIQTNLAILQSNLQVNVSNLLGVVGYVVGQTGREPYSSMQAAIDAAVADGFGQLRPVTIEVKPGRYTENLSLKAGVHLKAEIEDGLFSVVIVGNHQYDYNGAEPGDLIISGVAFYSPGVTDTNPLFRISGGSYAALRLNHCVLQSTDNGPALRLQNTGVRDGRLSNVEMYHCRVRSLLPTFAGSAVELRNGSLLMDEADIYLTNPRARSFLASGASQLLLDNATIRGWIETKDNVYLQLTQSSIDSGDQACLVQNSATAAVMLETMLVTTLPGVVVLGSGPVLYSHVGFFYSVYGIQQKLHTNPHALPITGVNAANVGYNATGSAHDDWETAFGAPGPIRVNAALDLLANGAARWIDEEVDPVFTAEGFYRDGSVPATGDFDMDGNEIWDADRIQVNVGAADGRVLTSDADGFGTWQAPATPPFVEVDPQVDDNQVDNFVPRWDDANDMLVTGTIFDNGNIGIGTPNPQTLLDIAGNTTINGELDMQDNNITDVNSIQVNTGAAEGNVLTSDANGFGTWAPLPPPPPPPPPFIETDPQVDDALADNAVPRWDGQAPLEQLVTGSIFNPANGNVGIGIVAPLEELHIASGRPVVRLEDTTADEEDYELIVDGDNFAIGEVGVAAPRLTIDTDGNVGIGLRPNVQPAGRLDVRSATDWYLLALDQDGSHHSYLRAGNPDNGVVIIGDQQTERTVIQPSGGKVGIGTYHPDGKLDVRSANNWYLLALDQDGSHHSYLRAGNPDNGVVIIGDQQTERTVIQPSGGKVGIGTYHPAYGFHINSDRTLRLEGSATANDSYGFSMGGYGFFGIDAPGIPNGRFVVKNNGNVGVGTPSPGSKLTVQTAGAQHAFVSMRTDGTPGYVAAATFQRGAGSYWEIGSGVGLADNEFGVFSGDVGTRVLTIKSGGNVGIGTVNPQARLVIGDPAGAANYATLAIKQSYYGQKGIWLQAYQNNNSISLHHDGSVAYLQSDYTGSGWHTPLALQMTGGNVGIGTPSPAAKLDVNGSAITRGVHYLAAGDDRIQALSAGWPNPPFLAFNAADGYTVVKPARYGFRVTNWDNSEPNNLVLHDSGYLWIKGACYADIYYTRSDDRLKFNEQKLDYGLAQVMALQPKRYDRAAYKYDPETEEIIVHPEATTNEIGLVAQDVQQVIPEAVTVPEDENRDLWSISYNTLIPVLINAIQEQQAQIEELKREVQGIKSGN